MGLENFLHVVVPLDLLFACHEPNSHRPAVVGVVTRVRPELQEVLLLVNRGPQSVGSVPLYIETAEPRTDRLRGRSAIAVLNVDDDVDGREFVGLAR